MTEPFVIRAHHIYRFSRVGSFARSGDKYGDPVFIAEGFAHKTTEKFFSDDPKERWYAKDTIGSPDREEEFKEKEKAVFRRFMDAPSTHPIVVVTCEPDELCKVKAVGNHCRMRGTLGKWKDNLRDWEDNYFNCFVAAFDHLYRWGHIKMPRCIEEVTLTFIDSYYPVKGRRFYTDKETFFWAGGLADAYFRKYFANLCTY